ncbi:sialidase family protein [Pedobacter gandavensis]|uniref:sialidase family protein n=1 Tax=Pedobacter gandavensis TaxID=2679963 RepID=UPI00293138F7|nr:sialidase family protein [Pedobacter gandavensis]
MNKKKLLMMSIALLLCLQLNAQQKYHPVFVSGKEGYKSFRIPAMIGLKDGTILAFCEGRVNNAGDFGDIDIVMKSSKDQGKTWSDLQVVAEFGNLQLGNPAPVLDLTDPRFPKGRIFLFYNTGDHGEAEIINGKGIKRCKYKTSTDGGQSWSEEVDITTQVHRPNQPAVDPQYNFKEDWRYYANTPGHAMQFQSGKYKGRMFVAANHTAGAPKARAEHYVAHGYYTDDHGQTFKLGNSLDLPGSNESMAAELSGGRLMMNSRNQKGDQKERIVSISSDGGASWDNTYFDPVLIDPVCQGSILNIAEKKGKNVLAFCNAADTRQRDQLTLRISFDDGKTWARKIPVYQGAGQPNIAYAAYSDLLKLSEKKIGVLFEKDNYSEIAFSAVDWK